MASGESSKALSLCAREAGHLTELWGFLQSIRTHGSAAHGPLLLPQLTHAAMPSDSALQTPLFPFLFICSLLPPSYCSSPRYWLWHKAPVSQFSWADQLTQMLLCPTTCLMRSTSLGYEYTWMCGMLHLDDGPAWAGACLRCSCAKARQGREKIYLAHICCGEWVWPFFPALITKSERLFVRGSGFGCMAVTKSYLKFYVFFLNSVSIQVPTWICSGHGRKLQSTVKLTCNFGVLFDIW